MGRLDPKYTAAQRQAAIRLVNEDGMHPSDAVELLATQGLGDIEAFEMPAESARKYAASARRNETPKQPTELAQGDIATAVDALVRRGISWADRELTNPQSTQDPDRVRKVFQTLVDIDKLAKANRPAKKPTAKPQTALEALANSITQN